MGLTVADVVELPKKKPMSNEKYNKWDLEARGYNQCLSEISSLPLSPEKVVGMVELSYEKILEVLRPMPSSGIPITINKKTGKVYYYLCKEDIANLLSSNKSKILSLRKEK